MTITTLEQYRSQIEQFLSERSNYPQGNSVSNMIECAEMLKANVEALEDYDKSILHEMLLQPDVPTIEQIREITAEVIKQHTSDMMQARRISKLS